MWLEKSRFQQFDNRLFFWFQDHVDSKRFYRVIRIISSLGDGWLYALLMILLLSYNFNLYQTIFYSSLVAYMIELPCYFFLKNKFKRNRPQQYFTQSQIKPFKAKIEPSDQFSFPSGHTAAAFVMATQVFYYFPAFGLASVLLASLIGLSRVLLGVHFPGDISAGSILGLICTSTSLVIFL